MKKDFIKYLKGLSEQDRAGELEDLISGVDLMDTEAVSSEIASSNATGWGLEMDPEILHIDLSADDKVSVRISFELSGDQDDDKPWSGTEITGEATVIITDDGEVRLVGATAQRTLEEDDDEEEKKA